jgi:hypothetical protein
MGLRDADKNNILHLIVLRGKAGRPQAPRACLTHALRKLRQLAPAMLKESNQAGQTPRQLAEEISKSPDQWGSNIKKADIDVLLKALK